MEFLSRARGQKSNRKSFNKLPRLSLVACVQRGLVVVILSQLEFVYEDDVA
jgi:hypothetical protein